MGASLETIFTQDGYSRLALLLLLGMPRLTGALSVNPIFSGEIFSGQTKFAIVAAMFMIPAPVLAQEIPSILAFGLGWPYYMAIIVKETVVGLAIGWVSGIVFWTVQSAGFLMDNQRGASMAAGQDPMSGQETSPLGSLIFQGVAVAFFLGGGFVAYLRLIWVSYTVWPLTSFIPAFGYGAGPLFFVSLVDWLMLQTLLLAGPVVAVCLLTDVSLGLVNRFASQLNVYILSMPIKSGLAMFILVSYYAALIALSPELFEDLFDQLYRLIGVR
ncbi:MAG: type III secretion system export apparatus subunit SctT [Deltaproteobacteria bacterium]|jgi:type III secretion protein T|nr:type III secretion system export apparatus subunit SctT [Deltaproteobacteria bacterium]